MNLWFRLAWALFAWRFRSKRTISDVGIRPFRVWPSDLDVFNHMNNGRFLALLDLGRLDLMLRSGSWQALQKRGWYPVVVAQNITFRKSLRPWQKFSIETRIVGWDDISAFIEQRFVAEGEIYARAIVRVRFLKRARGVLAPSEVIEACGGWNGDQPTLPLWIKNWADASALPKGREATPSVWN